jgi:hypothetical protein
MAVWCPIIPWDRLSEVAQYEQDLPKITEAYDDWRAAMRTKSIIGVDIGVLLDRIRMLMIKIGVACSLNRSLAEIIQSIVSSCIRERALAIVEEMPSKTEDNKTANLTLGNFFRNVRFTRDIDPFEEIQKATELKSTTAQPPKKKKSSGRFRKTKQKKPEGQTLVLTQDIIKQVLDSSSNVMKRIYMRLLTPDPWGSV